MPSLKSGTWREVDFQQWGELRIGEALPLGSLFFGPNLDLFPIWYRSHSKLLKAWVSLPLSEVSTAHDSDLRGIWRVASTLLCRDFFIFFPLYHSLPYCGLFCRNLGPCKKYVPVVGLQLRILAVLFPFCS